MNKLVTINPQKATTMGGVETLIRHIQELSTDKDIYEFFEFVPKDEHFSESTNVIYNCFGSKKSAGLLRKLLTKKNQWRSIAKLELSNVDTIILFHPNDLLYIPFSTLRKSKIILVQTNKFDMFFEPFSKLVMFFYAKYIHFFTVYTDKDSEALLKIYPKLEGRIRVIPRGCKLETSNQIATFSKKLVTIARIDEQQKNFTEMIKLIDSLPDTFCLDIYGDGSLDEVSALKNKLKDNKRAFYKGPTSDVAKTLKEYAVFIMTSRYEGFGQTLIEARSQGLPIVAYNNFDALTWIIDDGVNGYAVDNKNLMQFSQKIQKICADKQQYETMSTNALNKSVETEKHQVDLLWRAIL
ncbi:glycosyltransferase [Thiomicrorhabdus sp.]|uniref:glycosyltransferase n=1 Tax=Thiomicrorhabdus sp. TaxID=2039724 RepID=UPI002AA69D2E|nr:glycosyltransferase [Thiomicrorhabdus sp.]